MDSARTRLRILLIGSGGREHALAWKLGQSKLVETIFCYPGNGGTSQGKTPGEEKIVNVVDATLSDGDYASMVVYAKKQGINLVVPGPEQPLVDGVEEYFRKGIFSSSSPD
jgi:phosphoribosylamine--glycine ligase/phosphoribosylformylglycinamidine cyclo-ligase